MLTDIVRERSFASAGNTICPNVLDFATSGKIILVSHGRSDRIQQEKLMKAISLFLLIGAAVCGAPITIDFDGPVSTDITNAYAGLTFNAPLAGTGPVRTYASTLADTPGNL